MNIQDNYPFEPIHNWETCFECGVKSKNAKMALNKNKLVRIKDWTAFPKETLSQN